MLLNRFKKRIRRLVVVTGLLLLAGSVQTPSTVANTFGPMTTYAAEQQQTLNQSPRWEGTGDVWRVRTEDGTGHLKNTWFQDLDGSWYMLGAEDGTVMYAGLVTDQSTGETYYLNEQHDGYYGRMNHVNGTYTINGKQIYLEFEQSHTGSFGAVRSGLEALRSAGLSEKSLSAIPTDSATVTQPVQNSSTASNQQSSSGRTHPTLGVLTEHEAMMYDTQKARCLTEFGWSEDKAEREAVSLVNMLRNAIRDTSDNPSYTANLGPLKS